MAIYVERYFFQTEGFEQHDSLPDLTDKVLTKSFSLPTYGFSPVSGAPRSIPNRREIFNNAFLFNKILLDPIPPSLLQRTRCYSHLLTHPIGRQVTAKGGTP